MPDRTTSGYPGRCCAAVNWTRARKRLCRLRTSWERMLASRRKEGDTSVAFNQVRLRGLEPPRPCGHKDLNLARLPIPPQPPVLNCPAAYISARCDSVKWMGELKPETRPVQTAPRIRRCRSRVVKHCRRSARRRRVVGVFRRLRAGHLLQCPEMLRTVAERGVVWRSGRLRQVAVEYLLLEL